jgi:hypothetical protein
MYPFALSVINYYLIVTAGPGNSPVNQGETALSEEAPALLLTEAELATASSGHASGQDVKDSFIM